LRKTALELILSNKPLLVSLAAWGTAQVLKAIIASVRDRRLNLSYLITMGGMPSAHATLVCALATSIGLIHGLNSPVFTIAFILAAIVMYDAAGSRQEISIQATILNRMINELFHGKPAFEQNLRELIGHTKVEVIVGAVLGIFLAWWWT
jgi:acid phosphatase family membrane protein YuiD